MTEQQHFQIIDTIRLSGKTYENLIASIVEPKTILEPYYEDSVRWTLRAKIIFLSRYRSIRKSGIPHYKLLQIKFRESTAIRNKKTSF